MRLLLHILMLLIITRRVSKALFDTYESDSTTHVYSIETSMPGDHGNGISKPLYSILYVRK